MSDFTWSLTQFFSLFNFEYFMEMKYELYDKYVFF